MQEQLLEEPRTRIGQDPQGRVPHLIGNVDLVLEHVGSVVHGLDHVQQRLTRRFGREVQLGGLDRQDNVLRHRTPRGALESAGRGRGEPDPDGAGLEGHGRVHRPSARRNLDLPLSAADRDNQVHLVHEVAVVVHGRDELAAAVVACRDIEAGLAVRPPGPRHPQDGGPVVDLEILRVELHGEFEHVGTLVSRLQRRIGPRRVGECRPGPRTDAEGDGEPFVLRQRRGLVLEVGQEEPLLRIPRLVRGITLGQPQAFVHVPQR